MRVLCDDGIERLDVSRRAVDQLAGKGPNALVRLGLMLWRFSGRRWLVTGWA